MKRNNNKIDWLLIMPQDRLHGSEQLLMNLVTHLSKKGDRCMVLFMKTKVYGEWEHLEESCIIQYGPSKNVFIGYISLLPRLISVSRKYKIKKSFTSQTLINAMMGFLKKLGFFRNTTVIVRESNSIFHLLKGLKLKRYIMAYRIGYGGVDLVICQTKFMKDQLVQAMPWMKKKLRIKVLSNPIDLDIIKEKERAQLPIEFKSKRFIVAAGRLVPAKGFDVLIKSFDALQKADPKLELIILGEGPERQNLKIIAKSLNLQNKVHLIGFVNNVYPYFKEAAACVLSSRIEGFPNVLLQMMSQNTKVVSTLSAGGIEELDGVFTCEVDRIEGLAAAIKECLKENTDQFRVPFDENLKRRTVTFFINSVLINIGEIKNSNVNFN
jgi:glycosyltransferase involved in cell wall biosynthesis